MKRIIIHWTGGIGKPNQHEKECYHFLIDSEGKKHEGIFKPEDNENCYDGKYAQHTGGGNTGSIGVSLCGMLNYHSRYDIGPYPITAVQFEAACKFIAGLCKKYKINITPDTVMTHYEFGIKHPKTSSYGKPDITFLPPYPWVTKSDVGSFIRSKIRWYYLKGSLS